MIDPTSSCMFRCICILLIYIRAEITAFLTGVKNGEFDDLYPNPGGSVTLLPISHL